MLLAIYFKECKGTTCNAIMSYVCSPTMSKVNLDKAPSDQESKGLFITQRLMKMGLETLGDWVSLCPLEGV